MSSTGAKSSVQRRVDIARPNVFEIDLLAISENARALRTLVGASVRIFAALKANAYGYGLLPVAKTLLAAGVDAVSLSSISDAVFLRDAGIEAPILLYPGVPITQEVARLVVERNLIPTVLDSQTAQRLSSAATRLTQVFVKVDVGLERLGLGSDQAVELCRSVHSLPGLRLEGIYAHMHVPAGSDRVLDYLRWQYMRLATAIEAVEESGIRVPVRMAASTAVLQLTTSMNLNAIDPGRFFYGLDQEGPGLEGTALKPAIVSLKSQLVQVKSVERRDFLDRAAFPVRPSMRLGIVPLGSFDGLDRFSAGQVLVRSQRVRLLTAPSIEHSRLDLTDVPAAEAGDEVVILGRQGTNEITPAEVSQSLGSDTPGHLALQVRESVTRVYLHGGAIVE